MVAKDPGATGISSTPEYTDELWFLKGQLYFT